jgi:hypothetical protein
MLATSPLPKSNLPTATRGQNFVTPTAQADVRLRRRLSDKDKERRLVRRSSSKRKDKENGGKPGSGSSTTLTGSNDSPARITSGGNGTNTTSSVETGNATGNTVSSNIGMQNRGMLENPLLVSQLPRRGILRYYNNKPTDWHTLKIC